MIRWALLCLPCITGTALPAPSASCKRLVLLGVSELGNLLVLKKARFHIKILITISKMTKIICQGTSVRCKVWELLNMVFLEWGLFWRVGVNTLDLFRKKLSLGHSDLADFFLKNKLTFVFISVYLIWGKSQWLTKLQHLVLNTVNGFHF